MVEGQAGRSRKAASLVGLGAVVLFFGLLIWISSDHFFRLDLSSEKRFTLSRKTLAILDHIDEPVHVELYLEGDMPAAFRRLRLATRDMLAELQARSHGKLSISYVDPSGDEKQEVNEKRIDSLMKRGLQPLNLEVKTARGNSQHLVFPSAWLTSGARTAGVSLLQNQNQYGGAGSSEETLNHSVEGLEFAFANALAKITAHSQPQIGMLAGNGEASGPVMADLVHSLREFYGLKKVDLAHASLDELQTLSLLVMIKPSIRFSEPEKYRLDQYLMHGGKLLMAIDNVQAELDSMGSRGSTLGFARNLNLDDQLFRYGARINYDLVKDLNCLPIPVMNGATESSSQQALEPWIYYPLLSPVPGSPIVKNIDPLGSRFLSTLDTIGIKGIKKTFLLGTSPYTQVSGAPVFISLADIGQAADPKTFRQGKKMGAVLLEGKFTSVFANRKIDSADRSLPFLSKGKNASIILVSDGDVFSNQINSLEKSIYPLGFDKYTHQSFGNKTFAMNAVDYLAGRSTLIELRDKEVKLRMLDRNEVLLEKSFWQALNLLLPPVILVFTGLVISFVRRRRYA